MYRQVPLAFATSVSQVQQQPEGATSLQAGACCWVSLWALHTVVLQDQNFRPCGLLVFSNIPKVWAGSCRFLSDPGSIVEIEIINNILPQGFLWYLYYYTVICPQILWLIVRRKRCVGKPQSSYYCPCIIRFRILDCRGRAVSVDGNVQLFMSTVSGVFLNPLPFRILKNAVMSCFGDPTRDATKAAARRYLDPRLFAATISNRHFDFKFHNKKRDLDPFTMQTSARFGCNTANSKPIQTNTHTRLRNLARTFAHCIRNPSKPWGRKSKALNRKAHKHPKVPNHQTELQENRSKGSASSQQSWSSSRWLFVPWGI